MAKTYSTEMTAINAGTHIVSSVSGAALRCVRATVELSGQKAADTIVLQHLPEGAYFKFGTLITDTTLDTATVKIGNAADDDKYRAAAVLTTVGSPVVFGIGQDDPVGSGGEDIIATIAVAALPESGTLMVDLYYTTAQ